MMLTGREQNPIFIAGVVCLPSPQCGGKHIRKNGHRRGKQNHICVTCPKGYRFAYGRQFID